LIRNLFQIVQHVKSADDTTKAALLILDGILEDRRTRVSHFKEIQTSHNAQRKMDLVGILNNFLIQSDDKLEHVYMVIHIAPILIEALEFKQCQEEAKSLLNWVLKNLANEGKCRNKEFAKAISFCMMYLLKHNELARIFSDHNGFQAISAMLIKAAVSDHQVAYNVICSLWILSYHEFTYKHFEDADLAIIERMIRILDYFNKEKIVRITLLIIDNLKMVENCHEILSDLNTIHVMAKLQNRHWVDPDIQEMLEKIWTYLDEHYQEFSSIDKFRKESKKRQIRWGPVHTEKFWMENHMFFNEHLEIIDELIHRL
jgi:hypothetical protein